MIVVAVSTVARVSAEEHMANYRAARARLRKGRKRGQRSGRAFKEQRQEVRGEEGETRRALQCECR